MPIDIVLTDHAPYVVSKQAQVLSNDFRQLNTAAERAINESLKCKCTVTISQQFEWRVTYTEQTQDVPQQAQTNSVEVNFTVATHRENGDALHKDEIAYHKVYYGPIDSELTNYIVWQGPPPAIVEGLTLPAYTFGVTTVDTNSLESAMSNTVDIVF